MFNIRQFDTLDSTNKYIKNNIPILNDRDVVLTFNQTNGKGREDRKFLSSNDSLTFSILFKDETIVNRFADISLMTSSAVYLTLSKYVNNVKIKWPNDVYVNDAKICGILLEGISSTKLDNIIVGVGININNDKDFINSVKDRKITSLKYLTNKSYDLYEILNDVLNNFDMLLNEGKKYLDIINSNNYLLNKEVLVEDKCATIIGVNDDNRLIGLIDNKKHYFSIGEVIINK